jgi:hypothetical protein
VQRRLPADKLESPMEWNRTGRPLGLPLIECS